MLRGLKNKTENASNTSRINENIHIKIIKTYVPILSPYNFRSKDPKCLRFQTETIREVTHLKS